MNIDEYRALKAQEQENDSNTQGEKPNAQAEPTSDESIQTTQEKGAETNSAPRTEADATQTSETQTQEVEKETKPQTIEIDGKEVPIDELKNGYLRQSDYTKKTQEAKRELEKAQEAMKFVEQLQSNPQIAQQLQQQFNSPVLDPQQMKYQEMENKYYDMLLETEIRELENKYQDFDAKEVLQIARDSGINDLDTAYHVSKSKRGATQESASTDSVDSLKEQIRNEIMQELKQEQESSVDTSSIIQTGGDTAPVKSNEPQLSAQEQKVARMMGMNVKEYAKWRDVKKK